MTLEKSTKMYIPEPEYQKIIGITPIFCIDYLIKSLDRKSFLLLKRKEEPLKGEWWFPGGRMQIRESFECAQKRILKREIGVNLPLEGQPELIGISNYIFTNNSQKQKAVHTPTITFLISCICEFNINIGCCHEQAQWAKKLPAYFLKNINSASPFHA